MENSSGIRLGPIRHRKRKLLSFCDSRNDFAAGSIPHSKITEDYSGQRVMVPYPHSTKITEDYSGQRVMVVYPHSTKITEDYSGQRVIVPYPHSTKIT